MLELKRRARRLFLAINDRSENLQIFLKKLVMAWSKFSLKDGYRKKTLSTLSRLKLMVVNS